MLAILFIIRVSIVTEAFITILCNLQLHVLEPFQSTKPLPLLVLELLSGCSYEMSNSALVQLSGQYVLQPDMNFASFMLSYICTVDRE